MAFSKLALLASAAACVSALAVPSPVRSIIDTASDECRLPPPIDPSGDRLPHSSALWGGAAALRLQVRRHQAVVRVPSICYDDLGAIGHDGRWAPFDQLHRVLRKTYPTLNEDPSKANAGSRYKHAAVETINTYGLLYTVRGSDPALKPVLLMAHQDVVPVADASTWTHPPFAAHYDGQFLWGRGASDDKNSLTALLSTLETMLSLRSWKPRRTVLVSLGFDEECSGFRGAAHIAAELTSRYGDGGLAVVLDEGGFGIQTVGDVKYVLPSITEKGHVDVWFDLDVIGGHSSIPAPHTGIGIVAEIVAALEAHPYAPVLTTANPVYAHMACLARYSPAARPEITERVRSGDVQGLAAVLDAAGAAEAYTVRTAQAVDFIRGGQKINAMPEKVTLGVNYRVTLDDGIYKVLHNIVKYVDPVVKRYNLSVAAFEGDDGYAAYAAKAGAPVDAAYATNAKGKLTIKTAETSQPAPVSPMHGKVWDTFSGTAQHTLAFDGTVVPVGETMTGNTDTRHYQNLTPNIYRFTPAAAGSSYNIHTIDERVDMHEHMKMIAFYYDFVRNFDAAVLEGESAPELDNLEL
ncbi:vacuolar carboxypeptidase Cps1, putative [Cordyceps militaris CM01]|uniref:Vacuolar carboxypeptidase Cps1, putative n=1 Tax=Cordyceps militaris (strain CM01) TaxID=983644 RepID=G3JBJ9_CORMM|nr:vacuolar carboxypeptidase Cps1, putative [Cordyceps militaris CM01]EGX95304.1 vacuolar carboxypeptidase Cps1, putative [Cordyceps militaris CM01]